MSGRALDLVFLLSPANCAGRRAQMLLRASSRGVMADRLGAGALTLGEAFAFMSGLYFRGKLAYATTFAAAGAGGGGTLVITPTRGLQSPDLIVSPAMLREFGSFDVETGGERYRVPLVRDARRVAAGLAPDGRVVLLGSIATNKYVNVLADVFGARLMCPRDFVGRGDMSRGALLLRSAAARAELHYMPLAPETVRRGSRPPRLPAPSGLETFWKRDDAGPGNRGRTESPLARRNR